MGHVVAFSHVTTATIPARGWDEAWFGLQSWRGYLQSFPGFQHMHLAARPLDNGDVRVVATTVWEYPEQLEEWRSSRWSAKAVLSELKEPAYDVAEETYQDFS